MTPPDAMLRNAGVDISGVGRAVALRQAAGYSSQMTQAFAASVPPLDSHTDGVIRVAGTRVSLETVVTAFDAGATAEEIVQQYPTLDLAQVYAVISYLLSNRASVDDYLRTRRTEAESVRREIERRSPAQGIRTRLLARRSDR